MKINFMGDPQLNKLSIAQLPAYFEKHGLQRIYTAKNPAWQFDILSDTWQLGTRDNLHLEGMNVFDIPMQTWMGLRIILAEKAEYYAFGTVRSLKGAIARVGSGWQSNLSFQAAFHALHDIYKRRLLSEFRALENSHVTELLPIKTHLAGVIRFLAIQEYPNTKRLKGVFDPVKGVYTDEEMLEIQEKLRLTVSDLLSKLDKDVVPSLNVYFKLSNIVGLLLLISIYRRPVQLAMMKWSDVLPVGVSFKDHRYTVHSPTPEEETGFSDVDLLHLRTFKAKRGYGFREYAEHRSHRLEPEFSKLIVIYRYYYQLLLKDRLARQGIQLSEEEREDLLNRCPLFPSCDLFTTQYNTKRNLFSALGYQSDAMHKSSNILNTAYKRASKRLALSSTRIANFNISNNRSRHTVITNAIERGLSAVQAAAITGVTSGVIKEYIQLDMKGRVAINEAMAGQRVLSQFARISLNELKNLDDFIVKNEFDEVQGSLKNNTPCQTCKARICKPMGCYGCDNFRPFWDADHKSNLVMIEQKIAFNEGSNPDKYTLKKLQRSRLYCEATISLIIETKLNERGLSYVD
jgi:hypothetical protein